jgi:hypothetical protein
MLRHRWALAAAALAAAGLNVSGKAAVPAEADTPVLRKLLAFRVRF